MGMRKMVMAMMIIAMMAMATYTVDAGQIGKGEPEGYLSLCELYNHYQARTPSGAEFTSQSNGKAQLQIVEAQDGPGAFSTQRLVSFSAQGEIEGFGTVTWSGDPERTTTLSHVSSNTEDGGFPGTSDMYMHVNAELSWEPGRIFRSRTEIHVHNSNLNSWAPQFDEVYELVEPVEFEDAETGELAFTITSLTTTISSDPSNSCSASSLFGEGCSITCPAEYIPICSGGLLSATCTCAPYPSIPYYDLSNVTEAGIEASQNLLDFLAAYGTPEATRLAELAQAVIASARAGDSGAYSRAERNFNEAYTAISTALRNAIDQAREDGGWLQ